MDIVEQQQGFDIADLVRLAYKRRASDIHITAGVPPILRINGELTKIGTVPLQPVHTEALIMPIVPAPCRDELAKDGQTDFSYAVAGIGRCRVNIYKQRGALGAALRIIADVIPRPESLGLNPSVIDLTNRKRGMVLVTGPTGSGKSTTLASLVDVISKTYSHHVITLEDPIEYMHKHNKAMVNQREIGLDASSFAGALRASLREDPDVILVGEMRDLETISTAITAAETGHLVFSTLHTIGAASTIDRIIDVFPPYQQQQIRVQLANVLECVISQQLMPLADGTGRVAAFEVMHASPAIKNLIRESKIHMIPAMVQTSRRQGMITMDDAIYDLFTSHRIDEETAVSYAQDPTTMAKKVAQSKGQ
ncbi:MAG: type IV pilus twitching motility protein PilT [Lachnospiraceae bacterium]|nr:type IV pilus twitching motility protein PilT [Lachnospiraceae bacterium]